MDALDGVPKHLLGYEIKTRTQIVVSILLPAALELVTYLIQTSADLAVTIQHFRGNHPVQGGLTLLFVCLPAFVCFVSIISSPGQWPEVEGCNSENLNFLMRQLFNLLLFPIGAVYRFCRRIFWSIEALFYSRETFEREHSVSKAVETSPFELYHFVQAYTQSAPQIILQLFILLREDVFRNYETTNVQVLSVIFSLINLATITMSYQRFESQKIAGRQYPWMSPLQVQEHRIKFRRTRSRLEEIRENQKHQDMTNIWEFPENEKILQRFQSQEYGGEGRLSLSLSSTERETNSIRSEVRQENGRHRAENKKISELEQQQQHPDDSILRNITDDEKLNNCQMGKGGGGIDEVDAAGEKTRQFQGEHEQEEDPDAIILVEEISLDLQHGPVEMGDTVPDVPPPPPPQKTTSSGRNSPSTWQTYLNPVKRLSTFKDMLVMNAETYIKEHVPHPPRILLERTLSHQEKETISKNPLPGEGCKNDISDINRNQMNPATTSESGAPDTAGDATDFFLPRRRRVIKGVEQDDFVGKFVAFFGWILFIFMRMISLSVFCVFFPWEFLYLVTAHYGFMLLCLLYESRLHEKIERHVFYGFLAYVYIFVILEFRIKFKRLRLWYFGYFGLVMTQNYTMTIMWYTTEEYDSWWFQFLFNSIMASGNLCLACMVVYYCILKPNKVILLENS